MPVLAPDKRAARLFPARVFAASQQPAVSADSSNNMVISANNVMFNDLSGSPVTTLAALCVQITQTPTNHAHL